MPAEAIPPPPRQHSQQHDDEAERLIRQWQAGDQAAATHLYDLYKDLLYSWARLRTRDCHAVEDLCQEVWQRIQRSVLTYRPGTSPHAWMYAILVNTYRNLWRRGQRIFDQLTACLRSEPSLLGRFAEILTPEDMVSRQQELETILYALLEIPERFRMVVFLRYLKECSVEEVATLLDVSAGTVKSRLNRGIEKLRERLGLSASG